MPEEHMRMEAALREWGELLGEARAVRDAQKAYGSSTIGATRHIAAALQPRTTDEVAGIVRIAGRAGVSLYPISTGRNWGYGASNPVGDGAVLLDLSGLNGIHDFDPELGVVTLEPGVTQGQLRQFLDERGARYLVPVTGAGPTCSLVGNALERGYGITPTTDHFAAVTGLEAVLPDARRYRTPLAELGGAEVDRLFKWGVGPYLDGLFAQGNFGVVARMTIALAPAPEAVTAFLFGARDDDALERLVPAVRQALRTLGGNVPAINLLNRQRMLSMMVPFPGGEAPDGVLPPDLVDELARVRGVLAWNGVGAIYGSREVVRAAKKTLRRLLRPATDRLVFITPARLGQMRTLSRVLPSAPAVRLRGMADTLSATLDVMNGRPREVALPLAYWRSGERPAPGQPLNPARDGCGLIWYAPLVPMRAEAAQRFVAMVKRICPEYGINPLVTLTTVNGRCFDATVPLLFEREDPEAAARAKACYQALFQAGRGEGFVPYRLNVDAMALLEPEGSVFWEMAARLKEAVDPERVIAPGRYIPEPNAD